MGLNAMTSVFRAVCSRPGVAAALVLAVLPGAVSAQRAASGPLDSARALVTAIETADMELLLASFDGDATVFMPTPSTPARVSGKAAIRQAFEPLFKRPANAPPLTLRPLDLESQSFGDVAVVTFHLGDARRSRRSVVLRRSGGRWLIVHLHASNLPEPPR